MRVTLLAVLAVLMILPVASNGQVYQSPEDKIRHHLRMDLTAPFDIWAVRSKVLKIVHLGQPWQSVEKAMTAYGLGISSESQTTPCWPGDNGPVCEFKAAPSEPGGKRTYWVEFFFRGADIDNQVLEDVAVTLFKDGSVISTSKFYTHE